MPDTGNLKPAPGESPTEPSDPATKGASEPLPIANEHMMNHTDAIKGEWLVTLLKPTTYPKLPLQSADQRDTWKNVDFKTLLSDHFTDANVSESSLKNLRKLPMYPGYSAAFDDKILEQIRSSTKFVNMVEVNVRMHGAESRPIDGETSVHKNRKRYQSLDVDPLTKDNAGYNLAMIAEPKVTDEPVFQELSKDFWEHVRLKDAGKDVRAYVVDGGIMDDHPEFSNAEGTARVSLTDAQTQNLPPADNQLHGTHVAGIIGGTNVGVAPGVHLVDVGFFAITHAGVAESFNAILEEIPAPGQRGAVINFSVVSPAGDLDPWPSVKDIIDELHAIGTLLIAAAGNAGKNERVWPCAHDNVICVGYIGQGYTVTSSNYGSWVDIVAPGSNINSSAPGAEGYKLLSGTSMATPHVTGIVATILAEEALNWDFEDLATNAYITLMANARIMNIRNFGPSYVANNGLNNPDKKPDHPFFIPPGDLSSYPLNFPPKAEDATDPPSQDKPLETNLVDDDDDLDFPEVPTTTPGAKPPDDQGGDTDDDDDDWPEVPTTTPKGQ
ncbi:MAG: hypothetical protein M1831_002139 [Alyxoria varia]|nr:MAG: hypothetical protein M1831_002139 [Alyxoria varia]